MESTTILPSFLRESWGIPPKAASRPMGSNALRAPLANANVDANADASNPTTIPILNTYLEWGVVPGVDADAGVDVPIKATRVRGTRTVRTKPADTEIDGLGAIAIAQPKSRSKRTLGLQDSRGVRVRISNDIQINDTPLSLRIPKKEQVDIRVSSIFLNNREYFTKFVRDFFSEFYEDPLAPRPQITCANLTDASSTAQLLKHQELVRKYMNDMTPYRGLLIMHGLGAGKTRSSIAIAEGMRSGRRAVVMVPASLERNYVEEIKLWGDPLFRVRQFWEWIDVRAHPEWMPTLAETLGLSPEYITRAGGVWLVNAKKTEVANLDKKSMASLNKQIEQMIRHKYQFIRYNGLRMPALKTLTRNFTINPFDDTCVIVDEVHNLIGRIVNKLKRRKTRGGDHSIVSLKLYEYLMQARNVKIIMLSGTPIVNYPHEIAVLYNMLRGYIQSWEIPIQMSQHLSTAQFRDILADDANLDYLQYDAARHVLTITRNPYGFARAKTNTNTNTREKDRDRSRPNGNDYNGLRVYDERVEISDQEFIRAIVRRLNANQITPQLDKIKVTLHTALPDSADEFNQMFVDSERLQIRNPGKLSKRILGLTSYFRSAQEDLLPAYDRATDRVVVRVPLSDYGFGVYETARIDERKQEKSSATSKRGKMDEPSSSTYRIFSRLACNFAMPREIGRPRPGGKNDAPLDANIEGDGDGGGDGGGGDGVALALDGYRDEDALQREVDELEGDEVLELRGSGEYRAQIKFALDALWQRRDEFLRPGGLQQYGPKFLVMLQNIQDPANAGLHMVYSQFRNMEGIAIFGMVLEANGFGRLRLRRTDTKDWTIDVAPEDMGKPLYVLYTGTESADEREVIRNIYNGEWHRLSPELEATLKQRAPNNAMGEIVKVIMITAAGSEGINLRNTRFVHVTEPYWHPVRTEQVIGRARRICSHQQLPIELQTVKVFVYLSTLTSAQTNSDKAIELRRRDTSKMDPSIYVTTDEALFEISSMKETLFAELYSLIKATSIDCSVYSKSNQKEGVQCMQFANKNVGPRHANENDSRKMAFTFVPDFMADPSDKMAELNTQVVTNRDFVEIKQDGKVIYYQKRNTNVLYTVESVKEGEPKKIGRLIRDGDGYAIDPYV